MVGGGGMSGMGSAPVAVRLYAQPSQEHPFQNIPACMVHDCLHGAYFVLIVVEQ